MKFRKKPIVVSAERFFHDKKPFPAGVEEYAVPGFQGVGYQIRTLEGCMEVKDGDWVVTGIRGERYPVKPDIFEASYEEVHGE